MARVGGARHFRSPTVRANIYETIDNSAQQQTRCHPDAQQLNERLISERAIIFTPTHDDLIQAPPLDCHIGRRDQIISYNDDDDDENDATMIENKQQQQYDNQVKQYDNYSEIASPAGDGQVIRTGDTTGSNGNYLSSTSEQHYQVPRRAATLPPTWSHSPPATINDEIAQLIDRKRKCTLNLLARQGEAPHVSVELMSPLDSIASSGDGGSSEPEVVGSQLIVELSAASPQLCDSNSSAALSEYENVGAPEVSSNDDDDDEDERTLSLVQQLGASRAGR